MAVQSVKITLQSADPKTKKASNINFTKQDSKTKHRYLVGTTSGIDVDGHGESMTPDTINDFHEQTKIKNILLYVNHLKDYTKDIGILTYSEVTPNYDWYCEFRLYDQSDLSDAIPQSKIDEANSVWARAMGEPPYTHPAQFGFSIEGHLSPENKRVRFGKTEILKVNIDPGVTLVTVPAYRDAIAEPVMKQQKKQNVLKSILDKVIGNKEKISEINSKKWDLQYSFDEVINGILEHPDLMPSEKETQIEQEFQSYKTKLMSIMAESGFINQDTKTQVFNAIETDVEDEPENQIFKGANTMKVTKSDEGSLLANAIASLQMLEQAMSAGGQPQGVKQPMEPTDPSSPDMQTQQPAPVKPEQEDETEKKELPMGDPADRNEDDKEEPMVLKGILKALEESGYQVSKGEIKPEDEAKVEKALMRIAKEAAQMNPKDLGAEKLENEQEINGAIDGAVNEAIVKKALADIQAMKSGSNDALYAKALAETVKLNKSLVSKVNELETGMTNLINGFVDVKQFSQPAQTQTIQKGLNSSVDQDNMMNVFKGMFEQMQKQSGNQPNVQKSFNQTLTGDNGAALRLMFGGK